MTASTFKITSDAGTVTIIRAACRSEAIEIYRKQTGTNADYVRQHCTIRRGL